MDYLNDYIDYIKNSKEIKENTLAAYRKDVAGFLSFLDEKKLPLVLVSSAIIADYLLYLGEEGRSLSTINRHKHSINGFFGYLKSHGAIDENPVKAIKKIKMMRTMSFLTVSEIDELLSAAKQKGNKRDAAILELLYASGIRSSELLALKEKDLDFKFMNTLFVKPLSGEPRLIPIGKKARDAILEYLRDKKFRNEILFINNRGEKLSRQYLWQIVGKAAKKAGIEKTVSPQTFRDSFALHMLENGADANVVRELMGFKTGWSMDGYLALIKNRAKEVYDNCHPRA
jgi:integrase/recombinase XerD